MGMNLSYFTMISFPKASNAEHSSMIGVPVLDDETIQVLGNDSTEASWLHMVA